MWQAARRELCLRLGPWGCPPSWELGVFGCQCERSFLWIPIHRDYKSKSVSLLFTTIFLARGVGMALLGGGPRLVLLFSGKRKSGKDFVTEALQSRCRRGREEGRKVGKGAGEMPRHVTRGVC